MAISEKEIKPDFYFKTMNDNTVSPEETAGFFENNDVPLVGFKVLAGGALPPENEFRQAFEVGADFICVGMFDFQAVNNVNLINKVLAGELNRTRPWYS